MKQIPIDLEIRTCRPEELPTVIEHLDQEFIFNKQRDLSLSVRFPHTLSVENNGQILVAISEGVICGVNAIRLFDWSVGDRTWQGAMVGMVWVDSQQRRKGIASKLLSSTTQYLKRRNDVDFGVLWTGTPAVYERNGWFLKDCGLFGERTNPHPSRYLDGVLCKPLGLMDDAQLNRLSSRLNQMHVKRNSLDFCSIPIPADRVLCFCIQNGDLVQGFALVGEQGNNGYLYEVVAPPNLWNAIWNAVTEHFEHLFLNGHSGDPFSQWIAQKGLIAWRRQNKAMWICISTRIVNEAMVTWHIPYFDWI